MLTTAGAIAAIAVMALVTFLTRALPFLLFLLGASAQAGALSGPGAASRRHRHAYHLLPEGQLYRRRGKSRRAFCPGGPGGWVPALISVAVVVLLHLWKHNNLFTIFGGTIFYMVLVQTVFV